MALSLRVAGRSGDHGLKWRLKISPHLSHDCQLGKTDIAKRTLHHHNTWSACRVSTWLYLCSSVWWNFNDSSTQFSESSARRDKLHPAACGLHAASIDFHIWRFGLNGCIHFVGHWRARAVFFLVMLPQHGAVLDVWVKSEHRRRQMVLAVWTPCEKSWMCYTENFSTAPRSIARGSGRLLGTMSASFKVKSLKNDHQPGPTVQQSTGKAKVRSAVTPSLGL